MSRHHGPFATTNPWRTIGWSVAAGLTVGTALVGFLVLPAMDSQPSEPLWTAICTALGLRPDPQVRPPEPPARYASTVQWTAPEIAAANDGDVRNGAFVALNCTACHGAQGISGSDWLPSLAGMRPEALYKQLRDYSSGHRRWAVMNAIASALSDKDKLDVSAYFASLAPPGRLEEGRLLAGGRGVRSPDPAVRLVYAGDPVRGIAPCAACHGLQGIKRAAPVLAGQHQSYLRRQLEAFRGRSRMNDEGEQMRVTASRLGDDEISRLAEFLATGK